MSQGPTPQQLLATAQALHGLPPRAPQWATRPPSSQGLHRSADPGQGAQGGHTSLTSPARSLVEFDPPSAAQGGRPGHTNHSQDSKALTTWNIKPAPLSTTGLNESPRDRDFDDFLPHALTGNNTDRKRSMNAGMPLNGQHHSAYRERLMRIYKVYAPHLLDGKRMDEALAQYEGREEELLAMLTGKYGPEPTQAEMAMVEARATSALPPVSGEGNPLSGMDSITRLARFYKHYAPEKLTESFLLRDQLEKYRGREGALFKLLEAMYGPEPTERDMARMAAERRAEALSVQQSQRGASPFGSMSTSMMGHTTGSTPTPTATATSMNPQKAPPLMSPTRDFSSPQPQFTYTGSRDYQHGG